MNDTRPNILIFCVDEMRAGDMGCAGNPVIRTPHLDGLASGGTLFRRACCNNPICMPARATLFTGLLPRDHGLRVNGQSLRTDLPVLPGVFKDAGYRTHSAGKLHLTPWLSEAPAAAPGCYPECLDDWNCGAIKTFPTPYYGFDEVDFVGGHGSFVFGPYVEWLKAQGADPALLTWTHALEKPSGAPGCYKLGLPEELHYNRYIADATIRTLRESARPDAPPFFAWCSFPDPHVPVSPPAPYCHLYDPADMSLPVGRGEDSARLPSFYRDVFEGRIHPNGVTNTGLTEAHCREMIALTYGMITHVDCEIGRVLAVLRETGLDRHTIVIFTGDHGDMMGDHGLLWKAFYTFGGCIRIPLIVRVPGLRGGLVSDALTSQVDLFPSALELCGIPEPGADWVRAKTLYERGSVVPLQLRPGLSWRPVLEGTAHTLHEHVVIENDDPTTGLFARALVTPTHRLTVYPGTGEGELFDLMNDPGERCNLWASELRLRDKLIAELLDAYSRSTPAYPIPPGNA